MAAAVRDAVDAADVLSVAAAVGDNVEAADVLSVAAAVRDAVEAADVLAVAVAVGDTVEAAVAVVEHDALMPVAVVDMLRERVAEGETVREALVDGDGVFVLEGDKELEGDDEGDAESDAEGDGVMHSRIRRIECVFQSATTT